MDADGNVTLAVDFDALRDDLSDVIVDGPRERYQFTWPGKREAKLETRRPTKKTMRPCPEKSKDWDTTENVSGGQRQRLAIARALAKRPEVMVFDDSFSALDYKTDAKLREALATSASDSAVVVVAQRIATIMRATQIIVLDDGRVVGQGTHEELLRSCPTYLEIAQSQLSSAELGLTDEEIAAVMKGGER